MRDADGEEAGCILTYFVVYDTILLLANNHNIIDVCFLSRDA